MDPKTIQLNEDQESAVKEILTWMKSPVEQDGDEFFLLEGSAGTGKTTCIRALLDHHKGRVVFTAPTNKATKVIRRAVTTENYRPECRTIYSLLGLRLEPNGEVKELTSPDDPIDLSQFSLVVVDEGSMVNYNLMRHIQEAARNYNIKFLFMADAAQLPPVGEEMSGVFKVRRKARLSRIMRFDNQILTLTNTLRGYVDAPPRVFKFHSDHADGEGVWSLFPYQLSATITDLARHQHSPLSQPEHTKIIAWRNVTVDRYNILARKALWGSEANTPWLVGDRVIFTAPASDLDDQAMASTDDEGAIERISEGWHHDYADYRIFVITIQLDDNRIAVARVLHPEHEAAYKRECERLAEAARKDKKRWRYFWDFKDAFHQLRHAYAITAHRSQGSTYETAIVDYRDILLNQNRPEAFRCLYVAASRPKKTLLLG